MRKGQVFVIGALIFSSLLIATFSAIDTSVESPESLFNTYYSQSLSETSTAFNNGLEESNDPDHLRRKLYSYDRFVESRASEKGVRYSSINFIVLPSKGEAVLINYRDQPTDVKISLNGDWTNTTVDAYQWLDLSFNPGTVGVRVKVENPPIDKSFDASTHRLMNYARMERENEIWSNSVVY